MNLHKTLFENDLIIRFGLSAVIQFHQIDRLSVPEETDGCRRFH